MMIALSWLSGLMEIAKIMKKIKKPKVRKVLGVTTSVEEVIIKDIIIGDTFKLESYLN